MYDFALADRLSRDEIEALQVQRLRETVARAAQSEHYRRALAAAKVSPDDIRSVDDLRRLPLTTKDDLRAAMPWGLLAVPRSEAVRLHYSSGTTGVATAVYHTRGDLHRWAECVARGMLAVGVSSEDVFQNMMGYGLFTGGLGFHYAGELIAPTAPTSRPLTLTGTIFSATTRLPMRTPSASGRAPTGSAWRPGSPRGSVCPSSGRLSSRAAAGASPPAITSWAGPTAVSGGYILPRTNPPGGRRRS